jgi:hypothetical protein
MNIRRLIPVWCGIMLSGGSIASASVAQPTVSAPQVQHLTCVQDSQGLMCNVDTSSNIQSTEQKAISPSGIIAPALITTEQLGQGSDFLLGIMYFGLPTALVFAVLVHDQKEAHRTQLIAQLERIWQEDSKS